MADEISPSLPLTPTPTVDVPPEGRRRQKPGTDKGKQETINDDETTDRKPRPPHDGLIDEYA
ncbi:MAG: hypothetical protein JJU48_06345 [Methylophaga sp.]|nr:hypothetical protein [Methylophaga sp.]